MGRREVARSAVSGKSLARARPRTPARVLVIDCEVMFGIDYTGVEALESLVEDLRKRDIEVRLARVHGTVLERLRTSGALAKLGEENVFLRTEDATAGLPAR